MTPQERERFFNDFYGNAGNQPLFEFPPRQPVPIRRSSDEAEIHPEPLSDEERLSRFAQQVAPREQDPQFQSMPPFLRKIMAVADSENMADILYLGSLAVLSSCLPGVRTSWFSEMQQCNLYFFLTGAAATGKGRMKLCSYLVEPLNDFIFKESQSSRNNFSHPSLLPGAPSVHRFIIPANSSAPAMYEDIAKNDGRGLIFETEADTLALALRRGDFSDLLRKAFHGEPISLRRKTHQEDLYVENPYLSVCISGTPEQAKTLLKNAENGLFSRFLFYRIFADNADAIPTQQADGLALRLYLTRLGEQVRDFYLRLLRRKNGLEVTFSPSQSAMINEYTRDFSLKYAKLFRQAYGTQKAEDAAYSIARRMGLIICRMAMIRTVLRYIDYERLPATVPCNDDDLLDLFFESKFFMQHSHIVFDELLNPAEPDQIEDAPYEINLSSPDLLTDNQRSLLELLPMSFTNHEMLLLNKQLNLSESTIHRALNTLLKLGLVKRVSRGCYKKMT